MASYPQQHASSAAATTTTTKGPRRKPSASAVKTRIDGRNQPAHAHSSSVSVRRAAANAAGSSLRDNAKQRSNDQSNRQNHRQPGSGHSLMASLRNPRPSTVDIFGANSALFHAYEEIKKINKHADGQSRRIDASIQSEVAANMQRKNGAFDFVDSPRQQPGAPGQRGVLGDAQSHSPLGGKHFRSSGAQNNRQLAPLVDPALPLHQAMDARNHEMRNIHFAADHLVQAYKYAALESNISTETIMRTNEELMKIAKSVQRTSLCFQEVLGGLSSVPRYQAQVRVLSKIEKTYVNLFEKILKNVTLLERARIRLHEEEWREKGMALDRAKVLIPKLTQQITSLKQMLESQKSMTQQFRERAEEQEKTLESLYAQTRSQAETISKLRGSGARSGHSLRKLSQSITNSGTTAGKIMKDMRAAEGRKEQLIHQMHKSRALLLAQAEHAAAYGHNSHQSSGAAAPPALTKAGLSGPGQEAINSVESQPKDASSQTEVDEDGLWGVSDFVEFRQVSRFVPFRLWQRAVKFVRCPRCKGKRTAAEDSARDPTAMDLRPRPKKVGQWKMSAFLHKFLANLPPRIIATKSDHCVKPYHPWLTMQIDFLLDDKLQADITDLKDHAALQTFGNYICERYLIDRGSRQLAEVGVYEFTQSLKKHLKLPKAQFVAHFLEVIASPDNELYAFMTEQLLYVLNRARHQLRRPPAGVSRSDGWLAVRGAQTSDFDPLAYYEQNDRGDWTCLRHAIKIVRRTCEFLPFRKMIRFIRQLESTAHIRVTKTTGGTSAAETTTHYESQSVLTRGCVRSAIRNAILDLGESVASYMGTDDGVKTSTNAAGHTKDKGGGDVLVHQTAVIDVFEALHILVRIVALRRRPVEDKLRRLYIQADENCDGVLSFDEFKELIQNVEASTAGDSSVSVATVVSRKHSSDAQYTNRRIVRMYREAQESGGSSGSITRDGFIRICGKYGFIPFIDLDDEPIDERDQGSEASPE